MKKITSILMLAVLFTLPAMAQKYAFVDTDYILNKIPSYKAAQGDLDKLSEQYQTEIKAMYDEIDKMYREYQAEKVLLTEEMRSKREEQIIDKEREAKSYKTTISGRKDYSLKSGKSWLNLYRMRYLTR